tara:strand:- start:491 stop:679 length:189 start_codon:yes stop_codon:yes gene_type:complete
LELISGVQGDGELRGRCEFNIRGGQRVSVAAFLSDGEEVDIDVVGGSRKGWDIGTGHRHVAR